MEERRGLRGYLKGVSKQKRQQVMSWITWVALICKFQFENLLANMAAAMFAVTVVILTIYTGCKQLTLTLLPAASVNSCCLSVFSHTACFTLVCVPIFNNVLCCTSRSPIGDQDYNDADIR